MNARPSRPLAALLAALLVASAALAGVGSAQTAGEPSPADEIYVQDDGDAVLVYAAEETDGDTSAEYGVDVSEGLAYGRLEAPVEGTPEVRGDFAATATSTSLDANGSLSFPQPPQVENLQFGFSGRSTAQTSRSDLTLAVTVLDESGMTQLVRSAATSGELTTTASQFRLTGEFRADTAVPVGKDTHLSATLRESGETYTLSVEQDQRVGPTEASTWRNRTVARRALLAQYGAFAESLGGSATVSISSLSLSNASGSARRLDASYTLTYRGIDGGLERLVRASLAGNPEVSRDQADRLAREVRALTINEVSFTYDVAAGDPKASVSLDVADYDGLLLAYLEIADSLQSEAGQAFAGNVEQFRKQVEAQAAADLARHATWSGNLTHPDGESVRVDFAFRSRAENWQAYVEKLEARDVPRYDSVYELTGSSDGERISFAGSAALGGEDLFEQFLRRLNATAAEDPDLAGLVGALRESGPRKAKLVTSYDGDGFRLEVGAAFEDLAALRDTLAAESGTPTVEAAVGRIDEGSGDTYVTVSDAVGSGASRADVRALPYVGDETTVYMPGEGDRDFPAMDDERARSFLGLGSAGGSGPGFGPAATLLALLAAALLALRRR